MTEIFVPSTEDRLIEVNVLVGLDALPFFVIIKGSVTCAVADVGENPSNKGNRKS